MTKLEMLTKKAVIEFAKKAGRDVTGVRHIYPRAYVLGRAAPMCLLVACPPQDAEPHMKELKKMREFDGSTTLMTFDDSLKAGDWCSVAYVSSPGIGESIAVKAVGIT